MLFYRKASAPAGTAKCPLPPHLETLVKRDRDEFLSDLKNENH
jgi:hypothetical protein